MDVLTERVELGDGNWWEIRAVCTRGMRKAISKAARLAIDRSKADGKMQWDDAETVSQYLRDHPECWDPDASGDAMLLSGTVACSYGPVSMETFDSAPDDAVQKVLDRMHELYDVKEESRKNG